MVMAGDIPAQRRAGRQDDDVAAMVWRARGRTRTWVDDRLRCNNDVTAWVARTLRQSTEFAVLYTNDVSNARGLFPSG